MPEETKQGIAGQKVLICSHCLAGADLFRVFHFPELDVMWHILCSEQHTEADQTESTMGELVERFPELAMLCETPPEMKIMYQRGKNSKKWYDFHFDA